MSTYSLLGIPDTLAVAFVLVWLSLSLAPWLGGQEIGPLKVPSLNHKTNLYLRYIAPIGFVLFLSGFFQIWPEQHKQNLNNLPIGTGVSEQDALIGILVERYKENQTVEQPKLDDWVSSPLSITFLDISASGINDAERDSILIKISEQLRLTKRYSITDRVIINKLLKELNLSSSALADPVTALKLGRIFSAKLIVSGSLSRHGEQWLINLRFIETETTIIKCSVSVFIEEGGAEKIISELSKTVNSKLSREYPLQAKIITVANNTAVMNIGEIFGVSTGMTFELLKANNMPVDVMTVTEVEQQQSHIALTGNVVTLKVGMRLREQIQE